MRIIILGLISLICALSTSPVSAEDAQPVIQVESKSRQVAAMKVTVANLRRSYDFYTKVIGLKEVELPLPKPVMDDPDVTFTQAFLNFSGSAADPFVCLIKRKGVVPSPKHAELTWLGFKTDVRVTVQRVKEMGLPVPMEPTSFKGALVSVVRDPDGYSIELSEGTLSER